MLHSVYNNNVFLSIDLFFVVFTKSILDKQKLKYGNKNSDLITESFSRMKKTRWFQQLKEIGKVITSKIPF